jgi:1-acyl-sn-glycerol-3-phosphate acyltransferase
VEDPVQYRASRVVAGPFLHVLWRPEVTGLENIPATGGALLASNHLSILDSIFLPLVEYFTGTRVVDRVTAMYMRATNQLSVDRAGARAAQAMLEAALERVSGGALFGIYPEGTRSPDGRLYRGRTGIGWLALHSGVPVIPVAMIGTDRVLPPGHTVPKLRKIQVKIGSPLTFDALRAEGDGARQRRAVTDTVMEAIGKLSGQEYVPVYASSRKDEIAKEKAAQQASGRKPK